MGREDVLNTEFSQDHISSRQAEAAEGEHQVGVHHLESCGERIAVSPCSSMDTKSSQKGVFVHECGSSRPGHCHEMGSLSMWLRG